MYSSVKYLRAGTGNLDLLVMPGNVVTIRQGEYI